MVMTFVPIWFLSYNAQDGDSGCFIHACHVNTKYGSKQVKPDPIHFIRVRKTYSWPTHILCGPGLTGQIRVESCFAAPTSRPASVVVWFRQWIENDFWACLGYCHKCQWYFENIMRLIWNDNFLIKSFPKLTELLWYGGKMRELGEIFNNCFQHHFKFIFIFNSLITFNKTK